LWKVEEKIEIWNLLGKMLQSNISEGGCMMEIKSTLQLPMIIKEDSNLISLED